LAAFTTVFSAALAAFAVLAAVAFTASAGPVFLD
jgi:hypothetical protein